MKTTFIKTYSPYGNSKILNSEFWIRRLFWAKFLCIFILLILWARLFYLQIIKHRYYYKKAIERSVVKYVITAPRGQIITSDGVIVASNRAIFQLYIDTQILKKENEETVLCRLSKLLGEKFADLKERYYLKKKESFGRILIARDLKWDTVAKILVRLYYLPGVMVEVESERYYPYGPVYFHLIGYVSKISRQEYLNLRDKGYYPVDYIGKRGIERFYEKFLKGVDGWIEVERDAKGRLGRIVKRVSPVPGNDLILTINHKLQEKAYDLLKGREGSIVVLSVKDGSLLAMVSFPSCDPQKFVEGISVKEWKRISRSWRKPLLNRALSSYMPGSTYKVITAFTGLKKGIIKNPWQVYYCPGYFKFKRRIFRCWKPDGHGYVDLTKAIAYSCDVYFYEVASRLDVDDFAKISRMFGLGEKVLGWIEESKGLVPTKKWKKRVFHQIWFPGDTINLGIGQGYILVTPLQMARVYMAIANGGYLYKVRVVKEVREIAGKSIVFSPSLEKKINLNQKFFKWIKRGLRDTVKDGTGKLAFIPGLLVAGKTGTVQVVSKRSLKKTKLKKYKPHAWFVSYAGRNKPEIVSAILIEHAGHGGEVSAPIAKKLYESYFNIEEKIEKNDEN
jgi:penicillin-binding protein 2